MKVVIVGGGISGLAAAFAIKTGAEQRGAPLSLTLLESEARLGGKIWSIRDEGFLCEWGPNGFLDNKPLTLDLCKELGASHRLLRSRDEARKRFIYAKGRLHQLPESPPAFFTSNLLSLRGRLRIIGELWARKAPEGVDETLADFARRRLGPEALDMLVGPMVSGIFAGDPERMSLKSCFPRIAELEAEYGGLIRAMMQIQRQKKKEGDGHKPKAGPAGPGGILTSFAGGLEDMIDFLAQALPGVVRTSAAVTAVEKGTSGETTYLLHLNDGAETVPADLVVWAIPAYVAADLLGSLNGECGETLVQIPYSALSVVCFGYKESAMPMPLDGFGFLIPEKEKKKILGTLWDSSIFPGRAPEGFVSLRTMAGGACHPEYGLLDSEKIIANTRRALKEIMGIEAAPDFVKVFPHEKAIPQYTVGHGARVARLEAILKEQLPGFFLTGNAFHGIGINDCVASGRAAAMQVLDFIHQKTQE
ncbi:MAG: protoporphyrinogen oxidase [bacterium]|nr:protoporphyrinogen oxidase [bacterium]